MAFRASAGSEMPSTEVSIGQSPSPGPVDDTGHERVGLDLDSMLFKRFLRLAGEHGGIDGRHARARIKQRSSTARYAVGHRRAAQRGAVAVDAFEQRTHALAVGCEAPSAGEHDGQRAAFALQELLRFAQQSVFVSAQSELVSKGAFLKQLDQRRQNDDLHRDARKDP